MSEARERCPRLYRALEQERDFQRQVAIQKARGVYTSDVMAELMIRSMRSMGRAFQAQMEALQHMAATGATARVAFEKLAAVFEGMAPSPFKLAELEQRRREAAVQAVVEAKQRQWEAVWRQAFRRWSR